MVIKLNINWLNKCRCGNRMHTVETVRGSHVRLFEDDAVKCNSCGRKGVIQTCDGIATVLWETDEEHMTNNQLAENSITQLLNSVKLARDNAERDDNRVDHSFYYALTIALDELQERRKAELDSEPVADVVSWSHPTEGRTCDIRWRRHDVEPGPLYRHAQPAPVVQCPFPCGWDNLNKLAIQNAAFVTLALVADEPATESVRQAVISNNDLLLKVISACRAAMLQAGNSPVIAGPDRTAEVRYVAPPGYVMVPKEPTERMVIDGFESEPDEIFSEPEVWEKYQKMSGCEQAAYRARLCWAAMIAVAPPALKQENI